MHFYQKELQLKPYARGFHSITDQVVQQLPQLKEFKQGFLQVFIKHTSASITLNEDADPTVRGDFERHFNEMVPENMPYYRHNYEGSDDMPAHIKASLLGCQLLLPITDGKLNLGTWQGIYLCEHRDHAGSRKMVCTLMGQPY